MTTATNFLGIPVEGDITRGETRKDQKPIEELQPHLEAVLADETIAAFGWTQYTPYFNDGDACVFGVNGVWFATVDDEDHDDRDDLHLGDYSYEHRTLGSKPRRWGRKLSDIVTDPYIGTDEARYDRCFELAAAIEGGHFDHVLLDAFGDHAEIKVTRTGITVDSYSHD